MNKIMKRGRRAQLTIFVIIAIIIVVSIAVIIYANPKKIAETISMQKNPQAYIQKCARDAANLAVDSVIPNGGFLNPASYVSWKGVKAPYFCYAAEKEQICENMHPMIRAEIEREIYNQIEPKIEACFNELRNEFENYHADSMNLVVEIANQKVYIKIARKVSYTKNDVIFNLENFNTQIASPLYDFIIISNDIVNEEANCDCSNSNCNADIMGINRDRREYQTIRDMNRDSIKIYSIKEISSQKIFTFAVRNCLRLPY